MTLRFKNLFEKLNNSIELQVKQAEIVKRYNLLVVQYDELEHLKNNMNDYLGRDKTKKKESVIGEIKRFKAEEKAKPTEKKRSFQGSGKIMNGRCDLRTAPTIFYRQIVKFKIKLHISNICAIIYLNLV